MKPGDLPLHQRIVGAFMVPAITALCILIAPVIPAFCLIGVIYALLWRAKRRSDFGKISLLFLIPATIAALFYGYLFLSLHVAQDEWKKTDFETIPTKTRQQVENAIHFSVRREYSDFTDLFVSGYFRRESGKQIFQCDGRPFRDYTPNGGDRYVVYRVMGVMPIDAVYDRQDRVILVYPSFTH